MLDIFTQNPQLGILLMVALIVSLTFHEFSHAFVADKLGDPTAKNMGRLTLNPLAHLDPLGTLFLLVARFGWGKPVPFNPLNLKNPRRDAALISLAGPASNFILAITASLIIRLVSAGSLLGGFLYLVVFYNLILGIFNLIPVGPLDGNKIVYGFLPMNLAIQWQEIQRYGMFILLFLVFTNTTSLILSPLVDLSMKLLGL
ncbi:MAG: site-2 protease family protein [Patescibacteria group bacterium]|nr:site-2 protease family protein [Patescibacteria group bacterium]MBU1953301.1 site-2 protease family protein [Patescibacteria group bacterium]